MTASTLNFRTPAKINLALNILRKRPDGYHELETLLQMVSLYDEVTLERRPDGIVIECDQPGIPCDATNLAHKAARLLQKTVAKETLGVHIRLKKRIPAGGGLGGGSGNAAGVLLGLNRLWDLRLPRTTLQTLAGQLGSDVPFFLSAPTAIGRGRGELIEPLPSPKKFSVILVHPGFPIATAWVYTQLNLALTKNANDISILQKFLSKSDVVGIGSHLANDLESIVVPGFPVIGAIKEQLQTLGAVGTLLSGSGSTVFGIFAQPETAQAAFSRLTGGPWQVFLTQTVEHLGQLFPDDLLNYP
jgi:4-diphosphocytidyl-2-C-methyl-D-erythritol kinase